MDTVTIQSEGNNQCLNFILNRRKKSIPVEEIEYIESQGRKIILHLFMGQLSFYSKMSEIQTMMENFGFIRIHQSFMVRKKNISEVKRSYVKYGELVLPLSRRYYMDVRDIVNEQLKSK